MKKIFNLIIAAAAGLLVLAACEEMEEYRQTIEPAPKVLYTLDAANVHSTLVSHRENSTSGSYSAQFQVISNTLSHSAQRVKVAYDKSLVEAYNKANGTEYAPLPEQFLRITPYVVPVAPAEGEESVVEEIPEGPLSVAYLNLAADARYAEGYAQVELTGDLAELETGKYLVPVTMSSNDMSASQDYGTWYLEVLSEQNILRTISSINDILGLSSIGSASWVKSSKGNQVTIDMKEEHLVSAITFSVSNAPVSALEYSLDGENFKQIGTAGTGERLSTGGITYFAFRDYTNEDKDYLKARYIRFVQNGSYGNVDIREYESEDPTVYFECGTGNVFSGNLIHTPASDISQVDFSFAMKVLPAAAAEISGTLSVDNSLIADYNAANGTNYQAVPADNVSIENATQTIAPGSYAAADNARITLTGDLSELTDENGYIIPIKLTTTAKVSAQRRNVYIIVTPLEKVVKTLTSAADMVGAVLTDRTGWSVSGSSTITNPARLIDGSTSNYASFSTQTNTITLSFGGTVNFTGLRITSSSQSVTISALEYTTDGSTYTPLEFESSDVFRTGANAYISLYGPVEATAVRFTFSFYSNSSTYRRIYEIYPYAQ